MFWKRVKVAKPKPKLKIQTFKKRKNWLKHETIILYGTTCKKILFAM